MVWLRFLGEAKGCGKVDRGAFLVYARWDLGSLFAELVAVVVIEQRRGFEAELLENASLFGETVRMIQIMPHHLPATGGTCHLKYVA